jgi:hypothetical protein
MICKLQRSLSVSDGSADRMLIYSQDRLTIWFEGSLSADLAELMGDDEKIFVEITVLKAGPAFKVERRLPASEWPSW